MLVYNCVIMVVMLLCIVFCTNIIVPRANIELLLMERWGRQDICGGYLGREKCAVENVRSYAWKLAASRREEKDGLKPRAVKTGTKHHDLRCLWASWLVTIKMRT